MRKRQKFVLTSIALSAGLLAAQSVSVEIRYILIFVLAAVSWLMVTWSLKEGLSGIEWLTIPIPAVLFTAAVGLFYILLPQAWWARVLITLFFTVGEYALLLTGNIFSVAAIRTIALFRAASAVGFVMSLLTAFLLFDTILSFRLDFWMNGLLAMLASFLLFLPAIWSVELKQTLSGRVLVYSLFQAGSMGIMAMATSFWPISIAVLSLFLSTMIYVFLGVTQHHFSDRLFARTVMEYVTVGVVVTVTMLLTAGWGI